MYCKIPWTINILEHSPAQQCQEDHAEGGQGEAGGGAVGRDGGVRSLLRAGPGLGGTHVRPVLVVLAVLLQWHYYSHFLPPYNQPAPGDPTSGPGTSWWTRQCPSRRWSSPPARCSGGTAGSCSTGPGRCRPPRQVWRSLPVINWSETGWGPGLGLTLFNALILNW